MISPNEPQLDQAHETPDSIRVRMLFFGAAREIVGQDEVLLDLRAPATAASSFEEVLERYPELRRFGRSLLLAVNQEYAQEDALREVRAGDELAIFPPVSGGAEGETNDEAAGAESPDFFELTTEPIDVGAVARRVLLPECGATVTLDGYVREWTRGRRTLYLVYEAYGPMALSEMRRLCHQVRERFDISHVGIVHRTGRLEIGDTSVVISISAPHRRAAFEACEWTIKELKRTVPIWKKEFYEDGEVWVEGEDAPEELLIPPKT
jgi:molybdopterin converting factor subunit 1